jgi:hypothetical protein
LTSATQSFARLPLHAKLKMGESRPWKALLPISPVRAGPRPDAASMREAIAWAALVADLIAMALP